MGMLTYYESDEPEEPQPLTREDLFSGATLVAILYAIFLALIFNYFGLFKADAQCSVMANGSDDTKALQSELDQCPSIQLAAKTYLLTSTLRITHPTVVTGTPGKTAIAFRSPIPLESGIDISAPANVTLSGLEMYGEGTSLAHGIKIDGGKGFQIDHVWVHGIHGVRPLASAGILMGKVSEVTIQNSTFTDIGIPGRVSFAIENYYFQYSNHIFIEHNKFHDNQANIVIGLFDTNDSVASYNVIDQGNICVDPCKNNGYAILFYLADHSKGKLTGDTASHNKISNTAGSSIYFAGVDHAESEENDIQRSTQKMSDVTLPAAAIALNGTNIGRIRNNVIDGDAKGGICPANSANLVIEGNSISHAGKCHF
jgi:parallel beta-helix repeat protein